MSIFQKGDSKMTREEQLRRARNYLAKAAERDAQGVPGSQHALGFLAQRKLDYIKGLDVIKEADKRELYDFYRSELDARVGEVTDSTGIVIRSTFPEYG